MFLPLLCSIHKFFEELGAEEVSRRHNTDDKPYRMVKTILHEVGTSAAAQLLSPASLRWHHVQLLGWPCSCNGPCNVNASAKGS